MAGYRIVPVILAGGSGTRLWPFSREYYPKQLLPLVDSKSLLQNTALRLSSLENISNPIVICNESHRFLVAEQFRTIGIEPAGIILEPFGRNTAPAIAVAALSVCSQDESSILLVLPSDHHIKRVDAFCEAVRAGCQLALQRHLVTFGIVPTSPETGYGYIQMGDSIASCDGSPEAHFIARFVEKPDKQKAVEYISSGKFLWNSGMFMFRACDILEDLHRFAPQMVEHSKAAFETGQKDLDFFRLNPEAFRPCPSDSIDYAVMEKTNRGAVIPMAAEWSDLGSWSALWEIKDKDESQNVTIGDVLAHDTERCYLHASSRLVVALGIRDQVVIETPDAVLISPWDRLQDIKLLVKKLKESNREEILLHKQVYRPWGSYESLVIANRFQVKRLIVKPGAKLSFQKHFHRAEHWVVVHGTAQITRDNEQIILKEDESIYIPLGTRHRIENPGKIPLEIIEVQSGSYLGEDDIVRFDDVYGRAED